MGYADCQCMQEAIPLDLVDRKLKIYDQGNFGKQKLINIPSILYSAILELCQERQPSKPPVALVQRILKVSCIALQKSTIL